MIKEVIFYFGSFVVILSFVWIVIIHFKDSNIKLKEHWWLIILYIILLIAAIIVWRILFLFIVSNMQNMQLYNYQIESFKNG